MFIIIFSYILMHNCKMVKWGPYLLFLGMNSLPIYFSHLKKSYSTLEFILVIRWLVGIILNSRTSKHILQKEELQLNCQLTHNLLSPSCCPQPGRWLWTARKEDFCKPYCSSQSGKAGDGKYLVFCLLPSK